ncbi:HAD-IA family hydrolase [Leptolyngbya iicbica]|uniref:HAD family hydrolase n=2 Tax=Cyanophyceae TaxID=3028117 RepID=A0A4Q7EHI9_9CYAN|nr:HAD-IA family hydrolase [Leptolyngbya sp. LK]RZM82587.1 HAD family hydrolase [Leptolyngbya sp. LK]
MEQPKVIFLDAVGTLFGVNGSVGQAYATIAERFNVDADPVALNDAFFKQFGDAEAMAFPGVETTQIPALEYQWWRAIAEKTFADVDQLEAFEDFDAFFTDLYAYFAGAEPWIVYPDAYHSLERWKAKGIELGVISNFDSRLFTVLDSLALADFFTTVTISSEVGAAKPDPQIFAAALAKHDCEPADAWHVGDSYGDDFEGAKGAGLRAIWLQRPEETITKYSDQPPRL